jgi:protein-disulfide isomerase
MAGSLSFCDESPADRQERQMLKTVRMIALGAGVAMGALLAAPAQAEMTAAQKSEIQAIIKDYLVKNPEVVQEALIELEKRQRDAETQARAKALKDLGPQLTAGKSAVAGNPNGDVTVIEFFDYNCGFCKRGLADLQKLIKEDSKLKVVLKDLPILSPASRDAAAVAVAAKAQLSPEKFWEFHVKLMSKSGQIGKAQALEVARDVGADLARIEKDMAAPEVNAAFEESRKIADALGLSGTPSYIIADDVVIGAVGFEQLKSRIDNVRKCGKAQCS